MKNLYYIILVLLCCSCTKMEIATNTLLIADWGQTRNLVEVGDYENNIFLGEHPSRERVDWYFAGCILGNTILHRTLPDKYLGYYQAGLISLEVMAIANNHNIGLQVKF